MLVWILHPGLSQGHAEPQASQRQHPSLCLMPDLGVHHSETPPYRRLVVGRQVECGKIKESMLSRGRKKKPLVSDRVSKATTQEMQLGEVHRC